MITAYDLETCIMQRGYTRDKSLILEIGAYDLFLKTSFRCFVNPTEENLTKENYIEVLQAHGARAYPTKCHAENIKYDPEIALPLPIALKQFLAFLKTSEVLCAHNGRSFDDKIVYGSLQRCGLTWPKGLRLLDSYHDVSKIVWPGRRSYKLQNLHKAFCPESSSLKWHSALADSMGLANLLEAAARHTVAGNVEIAAKYVEKDYGIARINRQFHCNFPKKLYDNIGRLSKAAITKKLRTKNPTAAINQICLEICIRTGLWAMR